MREEMLSIELLWSNGVLEYGDFGTFPGGKVPAWSQICDPVEQ